MLQWVNNNITPLKIARRWYNALPNALRRSLQEADKPIPICLVGRSNVGKSTLFNRLLSGTHWSKQKKAMVYKVAGTTRDRKKAQCVFGRLTLDLVDTGGLESEEATENSSLLKAMREQCKRAIEESEAVLFVVDAKTGITPLDLQLSQLLRGMREWQPSPLMKNGKEIPVIVVANKAEGSYMGDYYADSYNLGFGDPVVISAYHNEGMNDLYDHLTQAIHLQVGAMDDPSEQYEDEDEEEEWEEEEDDVLASGEIEGANAGGKVNTKQYRDEEDVFAVGEEGSEDEDEEEGSEDEGSEEGLEEENDENENDENDKNEEELHPLPSWVNEDDLTPEKLAALRWYATHPSDPLGRVNPALKKRILEHTKKDDDNSGLNLPSRILNRRKGKLKTKEQLDYVMNARRKQDLTDPLKVAVVGVPNGGKSTLINAFLEDNRMIVDGQAGTTMDAIISDWEAQNRKIQLIDTCGIFKGWKHAHYFKGWSEPGMETQRAIKQTHVCILCIDATRYMHNPDSTPSHYELRLAEWIVEEGRALLVVINKWDLIPQRRQQDFRERILEKFKDGVSQVKDLPVVFISAKNGVNLGTVVNKTLVLEKRWTARIPTGKLNDWLRAWIQHWPPPWKNGQKCQVKYMTQVQTRPPTFTLWTNTYGEMPQNYVRQMMNAMREEFNMNGTTIKILLRSNLMPKPNAKLSKKAILKWKRTGPKQAAAVKNLNAKGRVRRSKQTE